MLKILESTFKELHKQVVRPSHLSILDKLVIMLGYYHDSHTMQTIAFDYGVSKSRICDAVKWMEETFIKDGTFSFPSLGKSDTKLPFVSLDATECETERPKKIEKSYSGKQKSHTIKDQILIDGISGKIICVHETKGAVHDFRLFQQSKVHLLKELLLIADKGYKGMDQLHSFSFTPFKKTHNKELTSEQKKWNRMISKIRIFI